MAMSMTDNNDDYDDDDDDGDGDGDDHDDHDDDYCCYFYCCLASLQYRQGAPPRHGATCQGPPPSQFYLSLASTFLAHYMVLCLYYVP